MDEDEINSDVTIDECPTLKSILEEIGEAVISTYRQKMASHNASGQLLNNLSYSIDSGGTTVKLKLQIADYFQYLENGRPPTEKGGDGTLQDKILKWIRIKGIQPYPDENGKLPSEENLAYLITRKIHNQGYQTPPQHCLIDSVNEVWTMYKDKCEEALYKDFSNNYAIKIIKKIKRIRV